MNRRCPARAAGLRPDRCGSQGIRFQGRRQARGAGSDSQSTSASSWCFWSCDSSRTVSLGKPLARAVANTSTPPASGAGWARDGCTPVVLPHSPLRKHGPAPVERSPAMADPPTAPGATAFREGQAEPWSRPSRVRATGAGNAATCREDDRDRRWKSTPLPRAQQLPPGGARHHRGQSWGTTGPTDVGAHSAICVAGTHPDPRPQCGRRLPRAQAGARHVWTEKAPWHYRAVTRCDSDPRRGFRPWPWARASVLNAGTCGRWLTP